MKKQVAILAAVLLLLFCGCAAADKPVYSLAGGFYPEGESLELSLPAGANGVIRYTLDGTSPTADSPVYETPIPLTDVSGEKNRLSMRTDICWPEAQAPEEGVPKCLAVRAAVFRTDGSRGEIASESYFIGDTAAENFGCGLVCSLFVELEDFFGYERGIYVNGAAFDQAVQASGIPGDGWVTGNYTQRGREWERVADVCFFEDGVPVVQGPAGVRIKGNYTRGAAQKSMNLFTRGEYGMKKLKYDFFGLADAAGNPLDAFDGITLRNGGNDNPFTLMRDSIHQQLMGEALSGIQASRPCTVFLNGEFWGLYQLMEKQNGSYLHSHYGVDKNRILLVKNGETEDGAEESGKTWEREMHALSALDYSEQENRDALETAVDVPELLYYTAAQAWLGNFDWIRNIAMWKTDYTDDSVAAADGRWHMLVFDTENGSAAPTNEATAVDYDPFEMIDYAVSRQHYPLCDLISRMLEAEEYRHRFSSMLLEVGNTVFEGGHAGDVASEWEEQCTPLILLTRARFDPATPAEEAEMDLWDLFSELRGFFEERFDWMAGFMSARMDLSGEQLWLTVSGGGEGGNVRLNRAVLEEEKELCWLAGVPLYLTAVPEQGFCLNGWQAEGGRLEAEGGTAVFYPEEDGCTVYAIFSENN